MCGMSTTSTKKCTKCKEHKPLTEFGKDKTRSDGLQYSCRACTKLTNKEWYLANKDRRLITIERYRQENPEAVKQRKLAWQEANKEHIKAVQKMYDEANKEAQKEYRARWHQENKERNMAKKKAWYAANKEKLAEKYKAKAKEWRIKNRPLIAAHSTARRAKIVGATPLWADIDAIKDFYIAASAFKLYTGQEYHVDHIVPIKGKTVCGLHVQNNLQLLLAKDNQSKGCHHWPDKPGGHI
jgi:hypothetical protein